MAQVSFISRQRQLNRRRAYEQSKKLTKSLRRFWIKQVEGSRNSITLPYNPLIVDYQEFGLAYNTVDRPTQRPFLVPEAPRLRVISFDFVMTDRQSRGRVSIEDKLRRLQQIANEDSDLEIAYGYVKIPYRVRITDFSYSSRTRDRQGRIRIADCSIQFTEAPNISEKVLNMRYQIPFPGVGPGPSKAPANPGPGSGGGGSGPTQPPPPGDEGPGYVCHPELDPGNPDCKSALRKNRSTGRPIPVKS